jgi:hypothetical protein
MVTETCTSLSSWKNPSSQIEPFSNEGKKERKNTLNQKRKWDYPPKSSF